MKIFYSPKTGGFYSSLVNIEIPADCVEVPVEEYYQLLEQQADGMRIIPGENGFPTTQENIVDLSQMESEWVDREMQRVRDELEKVQDSDSDSTGTVSDWRAYRKALRAWLSDEHFPDNTHRPISPDGKE